MTVSDISFRAKLLTAMTDGKIDQVEYTALKKDLEEGKKEKSLSDHWQKVGSGIIKNVEALKPLSALVPPKGKKLDDVQKSNVYLLFEAIKKSGRVGDAERRFLHKLGESTRDEQGVLENCLPYNADYTKPADRQELSMVLSMIEGDGEVSASEAKVLGKVGKDAKGDKEITDAVIALLRKQKVNGQRIIAEQDATPKDAEGKPHGAWTHVVELGGRKAIHVARYEHGKAIEETFYFADGEVQRVSGKPPAKIKGMTIKPRP